MNQEFIFDEEAESCRLDLFLSDKLSGYSRSQCQKLIKEQKVFINDKPASKNGQELVFGDAIRLDILQTPSDNQNEILPEKIDLDIVHEDEDIIVINKSAEMVVHPGKGNWNGTLVNALLFHCQGRLSFLGGNERAGIVHRLDKGTSGLIVAAKNEESHRHLALQFEQRTAFRVYKAFCWHKFSENKGIIESFLGRHKTDPTRQAVYDEKRDNTRYAITKYIVEEEYPFISLCRFKLETGRTHQIRVHSAHINHPVFADSLYGGDERQVKSIHLHYQKFATQLFKHIQRQALHAQKLELTHPKSNRLLSFESNFPEDMAILHQKLRNRLL